MYQQGFDFGWARKVWESQEVQEGWVGERALVAEGGLPVRVYWGSTEVYWGSTRVYWGSTRVYWGSTRVYWGSTRVYWGSIRGTWWYIGRILKVHAWSTEYPWESIFTNMLSIAMVLAQFNKQKYKICWQKIRSGMLLALRKRVDPRRPFLDPRLLVAKHEKYIIFLRKRYL